MDAILSGGRCVVVVRPRSGTAVSARELGTTVSEGDRLETVVMGRSGHGA